MIYKRIDNANDPDIPYLIEILMQNEKNITLSTKKAYHQNPLPFKDFMLH